MGAGWAGGGGAGGAQRGGPRGGEVGRANGGVHVWLAGSHNHRDEEVTGLFRSIAKAAPGSYGVMYVLDDDDGCTWERLVMRRGAVILETDTSLSPHIGVAEDPSGL